MFGSDDDAEAARKKRLEEEAKKQEEERLRKKEERKAEEARKAKQAAEWEELRKELDKATDPSCATGADPTQTKAQEEFRLPLLRPFGGPAVGPPKPMPQMSGAPGQVKIGYQPSTSPPSSAPAAPQLSAGSSLKRPF